jgi:6-phospho-beta-glucosidase
MAFGFIDATWNNNTKWLIVNTQNNGAYRYLPDDAVIEVSCMINKAGVHPMAVNEVPKMIWGLVASVKNYEQLTVEAAMTGDKTTALYALMAHPLVRDFEVAKGLLTDLLEANKKYLPNFFKD